MAGSAQRVTLTSWPSKWRLRTKIRIYNPSILFKIDDDTVIEDYSLSPGTDILEPEVVYDAENVQTAAENEGASDGLDREISEIRNLIGDPGKVLVEVSREIPPREDIRGKVVNDGGDVARLLARFRAPSFEIFHIVYVNDEGRILAHNALTSRSPGAAIAAEKRFYETAKTGADYVKDRMRRLGATGYYLAHNHPSDNVEPSRNDMDLTNMYAKMVPGFKEHV